MIHVKTEKEIVLTLTMVPQMNLTELSPAPCVSRAFFPASITAG